MLHKVREAARTISAYTSIVNQELPVLRSSWSEVSSGLYALIDRAWPAELSADEIVAMRKLQKSLVDLRSSVASGAESLEGLGLAQANLVKSNVSRDLSIAAYDSERVTRDMVSVFGQMTSELQNLSSNLSRELEESHEDPDSHEEPKA